MKKNAPHRTMTPKARLLLSLKAKNSERQAAAEIQLIPFDGFKSAVKKVLSVSKTESDKELAEFQAANAKKRKAKKQN